MLHFSWPSLRADAQDPREMASSARSRVEVIANDGSGALITGVGVVRLRRVPASALSGAGFPSAHGQQLVGGAGRGAPRALKVAARPAQTVGIRLPLSDRGVTSHDAVSDIPAS